jgi:hypothetical protein
VVSDHCQTVQTVDIVDAVPITTSDVTGYHRKESDMARKTASNPERVRIEGPREPTVKSVAPRKTAKSKATEVVAPAVEITDEMIRARAHQLWLKGVPGTELDHWFHARKLLEAELGR